ncbi:MAG: SDR family oxidoreductase [Mycobacterium sp.]|nr:SDR family oxidoreductase [Mycobacterium sp.]
MDIESTQQVLQGTTAVVTGGGRGLGRVLAQGLAGAGAAVGLIARSTDQLAESVRIVEESGGVAVAATADVADPRTAAAAMTQLRDQLGHIDLLVNNAGVSGPVGPAWEVAEEDWWHTVEVNLRGVEVCSRLVLPEMIARRRGRIVNITSRAGVYRWPLLSAYSVSKAAVVKYVENLAQETKRYGLAIFSLHPGILPIGFGELALASANVPVVGPQAGVGGWIREELTTGRGAEPHEVAELLVRIAAGDADLLTGRHLTVGDDLDDLLSHIEEIRGDDSYLLRVRTLTDT